LGVQGIDLFEQTLRVGGDDDEVLAGPVGIHQEVAVPPRLVPEVLLRGWVGQVGHAVRPTDALTVHEATQVGLVSVLLVGARVGFHPRRSRNVLERELRTH
jgi:hypothetical protein